MVFLGVLRPRLKKRLWHRCFPVNFVKFLRTSFFTEHLRWLILVITVNLLLTSRIVKMWFRTYNKNLLNGISCCCSDLSYIYWLFILSFKLHHDQVSLRSYRWRFCSNNLLSIYLLRNEYDHFIICYYLSINFTKLLPLDPKTGLCFSWHRVVTGLLNDRAHVS